MKGAKPLSRLKNHIKMHLGIKSCVCEKCNQRFANQTRFRDHYGYVTIKSVSSGVIPICLTANVFTFLFSRQSEKRTHECSICKKYFGSERYLILHQRSHIHVYKCPVPGCLQSHSSFSSFKYVKV